MLQQLSANAPFELLSSTVYNSSVHALHGDLAQQAIRALFLILSNIGQQVENSSLDYNRDDLRSPDTLHQEGVMWRTMGRINQSNKLHLQPQFQIAEHVQQCMNLLTSVTSNRVERANSSLRYVKKKSILKYNWVKTNSTH